MYLLGLHGNNLYPSTLRLFSDQKKLLEHLHAEWQRILLRFEEEGVMDDRWVQRHNTFEGYIKMSGWRLYRINSDSDKDTENIRMTTVIKWANEMEFLF